MKLEKTFRILEGNKHIVISVSEYDNGVLVSGFNYRKRKSVTQIAYERNKWTRKGYAEEKDHEAGEGSA